MQPKQAPLPAWKSWLAHRPASVMAVGFLAMLLMLAFLGWQLATKALRISVQESTEAANKTLTRVFVNETWDQVKPLLPAPGSNEDAARKNPSTAQVDQLVRRFSTYTDVLKVKIYDLNGMTVYSSDPSQIGEDKSRNLGFQSAARGQVASELTYRGKFGSFDGELFQRNLVSSYAPVRAGDRIEAVVEIYSDRTASLELINRELQSMVVSFAGVAGLGLALVAAMGWWVQRQYRRVEQEREQQARHLSAREQASANYANSMRELMGQIATRLRAGLRAGWSAFQTGAQPPSDAADPPASQSLNRLCEDLEELAADRAQVRPVRAFGLDALLDAQVGGLRRRAQATGVDFSEFRQPGGLGTFRGDAEGVERLLWQLLDHAAQVTTQGGIQLRALRIPDGVRLEVIDTSPGMPQSAIDHLQAAWREGRQPPWETLGGSGLALWVMTALASRLGGRADLRSTPGHGNLFSVELPLTPETVA